MRPLSRPRLYQGVVDHLEKQLDEGVYRPGDELPSERNLMKELGVGRPAIREALFALQKMGLVELRAGERPRVIEPTHKVVIEAMRGPIQRLLNEPNGLRNFQRARVFFEVGLVREAALTAQHEDLERLEAALTANLEAAGNLARFERSDVEFHYVLAQISRNPIFLSIHDAVFDLLYDQRRMTLRMAQQIENVCREHKEIFEAVRDSNPERAERAMRGHLDRGHALYWSATMDLS